MKENRNLQILKALRTLCIPIKGLIGEPFLNFSMEISIRLLMTIVHSARFFFNYFELLTFTN